LDADAGVALDWGGHREWDEEEEDGEAAHCAGLMDEKYQMLSSRDLSVRWEQEVRLEWIVVTGVLGSRVLYPIEAPLVCAVPCGMAASSLRGFSNSVTWPSTSKAAQRDTVRAQCH
jgi:hypothetical protein